MVIVFLISGAKLWREHVQPGCKSKEKGRHKK